MYLGSFKTYFSGRNRIVLPRKFRRELGSEDKFYLLLGDDGEIWGFDQINWSKLTENILQTPLTTKEGRVKRLNFFSRAEECILDNQGRFILPQEFMDRVNLKEEVCVVGAGDHFEIWDPVEWNKYVKKEN